MNSFKPTSWTLSAFSRFLSLWRLLKSKRKRKEWKKNLKIHPRWEFMELAKKLQWNLSWKCYHIQFNCVWTEISMNKWNENSWQYAKKNDWDFYSFFFVSWMYFSNFSCFLNIKVKAFVRVALTEKGGLRTQYSIPLKNRLHWLNWRLNACDNVTFILLSFRTFRKCI